MPSSPKYDYPTVKELKKMFQEPFSISELARELSIPKKPVWYHYVYMPFDPILEKVEGNTKGAKWWFTN